MGTIDLLGFRVVFGPDPLKLIQVMWPQNGPIPSEVVEVVHDDSNKQVNDLANTKEILLIVLLVVVVVVDDRYQSYVSVVMRF